MTPVVVQLTKTRISDGPPDAFLGPWCIPGEAPGRPVLSEGAPPEVFAQVGAEFPDLHRRVVAALTEVLNRTFGVTRSERYWALLTHPLLYHYLVSYLVKWKVVERALGSRSEGYEALCAFPRSASTPLLYSDLRVAYEEDDRFNLELFSLVCRGLGVPGATSPGIDGPRASRTRGSRAMQRRSRALYAWITEAKRSWTRARTDALGEDAVLYKDMEPAFATALGAATGLRFVPLDEVANLRSRPRLSPDGTLRGRASWSHADPLVDGILGGLRYHLPVRQLEGYPSLLRDARRRLDWSGDPAAVLFSILERPGYRVFTAEAMERGARIVSIQHGGNYGESAAAVSEGVERSFSDRFVTFGWRKDPEKDVPAGGFRTGGLSTAPEAPADGDVLLVAPLFQEYPHHVNWAPLDRQRDRTTLLERLPPAVRRRLVVRMRPARTASARLEREWLAPFPEIRLDEAREPIGAAMSRSSLVVIGYVFSTTLLEAVRMDRPFLVFDQGFESLLTPTARPAYDALRKAGLMRTDPVETAAAIPTILEDVSGWWSVPTRRTAVARYRERFVQEADLGAWTDLVRELVAGERAP